LSLQPEDGIDTCARVGYVGWRVVSALAEGPEKRTQIKGTSFGQILRKPWGRESAKYCF